MYKSLLKLICLFSLGWLAWNNLLRNDNQITRGWAGQAELCLAPVGWRLVELDPAFRLTEAEAVNLISTAAEQWNRVTGLSLFVHDPLNGFPIYFQYDERQQQLAKRLLLQRNVQRYDEHLDILHQHYQRQLALVQQQAQRVEQLQQVYHQQVSELQQGGQTAPAGIQQQWRILEEEQRIFRQQKDALNTEQQRLEQMINRRNALLPEQQVIASHELGVMTIKNKQRKMVIYAFADKQDLLVTLQHEFGHALGLPHSPDKTSVMHAQLNSEQQWLTASDFALWQNYCGN